MSGPSTAILADFTMPVSAAAITIGFGVIENGAKWCSAVVTQS